MRYNNIIKKAALSGNGGIMTKAIKGILLDFDGTSLQTDQVYLSLRTMHALKSAINRGVEIIPCTGRAADMFPPQIEREKRIRYWVTSNGARVLDRHTGEVIYSSLFTPEESAMLCRLFEGRRIYSEIAAEGKIYVETEISEYPEKYAVPPHHVWFFEEKRQIAVDKPSEYFLKTGIGIEKVNIYGMPEGERAALMEALENTGIVRITAGERKDIQLFPKRQSRTKAVETLFARLGFGFDSAMSLGDAELDMPMLEKCAMGIAMGNAPAYVKQAADYVTDPFYEDGAAKAIERFVLNGEDF